MATDESISPDELATCIKVLSTIRSSRNDALMDSTEYQLLRPLVRELLTVEKQMQKKQLKTKRLQAKSIDHQARNTCLLRSDRAQRQQQLQLEQILVPDGPALLSNTLTPSSTTRLLRPTLCYICKLRFRTLHFFYDRLCPACASLNFTKRSQTADLSNRVALVTGARVKIGYRILLKLLRAQCFVIATSRFPMDLLTRLAQETDFAEWKHRVRIYGIDFRYAPLIEQFARMLIHTYDRLDFLINNACQTIQRPADFYQHLIQNERLTNYALLPNDQQQVLDGNLQFYQRFLPPSHRLSLPSDPHFVRGASLVSTSFDVHQQPIDFRTTNSWMLRLADVSAAEISEVLTINTLAPFILNSQLKALMADRHPDPDSKKFIINVSAMEGSFARKNKTDRHPHTNAAKAALNMMTRTSAKDYVRSNIYMVSVDTGKERTPSLSLFLTLPSRLDQRREAHRQGLQIDGRARFSDSTRRGRRCCPCARSYLRHLPAASRGQDEHRYPIRMFSKRLSTVRLVILYEQKIDHTTLSLR